MSSPTPVTIAAENGPWTQLRTGIVTAASTTSLTVLVGGTQVQAAFPKGTTFLVGDLVMIARQDASWAVLYAIAGFGPNEIQNPSFENSGTGMPPVNWIIYDITGISQVSVAEVAWAPDGTQYAEVFSDSATSQSYLYSEPIPVTAGDVFNVSAYVTGFYAVDAAQTADAALVGLWFASPANLYPTTSSADIVIATYTDVPSGPPFVQLSGQVTAPVTGFFRLALRSTLAVNQSLGWDLAIAREVG